MFFHSLGIPTESNRFKSSRTFQSERLQQPIQTALLTIHILARGKKRKKDQIYPANHIYKVKNNNKNHPQYANAIILQGATCNLVSTAMFSFEILYNCLVYKLMYKIRPKTCYSTESLSDSFLFIFFFKHNHIRYRIKSFVYLESPLDSKTAAD